MKKQGSLILMGFLSLVFSMPLFAEIDLEKVQATLKLDKAKVKIGETVTAEVNVKAPIDYQIEIEEIGQKIYGLRIIDAGLDQPYKDDDEFFHRKWYKLETDLSGSYVLPEAKVSISLNGEKEILTTSEVFLEVEGIEKSSEGEEVKELRDIKPLIKVNHGLPVWAKIVILISILVFAGGAIYFIVTRKKKDFEKEIITPPHEKALLALGEIEQYDLSDITKLKKFHFRLSEIFRNYVEDLYGFKATDMTFEEIKRNISSLSNLKENLKSEFLYVLEKSDIVKFTDHVVTIEEGQSLLAKTKNFIEKTTVKEVPVEEEVSI